MAIQEEMKTQNDTIYDRLVIAPVEKKKRFVNQLRWFGHVQRRSLWVHHNSIIKRDSNRKRGCGSVWTLTCLCYRRLKRDSKRRLKSKKEDFKVQNICIENS